MEFADLISIPRVDNVILIDKTKDKSKDYKIEGTLCISGHHLILSDRQKSDQQELWVLIIIKFCYVKLFNFFIFINMYFFTQNSNTQTFYNQ